MGPPSHEKSIIESQDKFLMILKKLLDRLLGHLHSLWGNQKNLLGTSVQLVVLELFKNIMTVLDMLLLQRENNSNLI